MKAVIPAFISACGIALLPSGIFAIRETNALDEQNRILPVSLGACCMPERGNEVVMTPESHIIQGELLDIQPGCGVANQRPQGRKGHPFDALRHEAEG